MKGEGDGFRSERWRVRSKMETWKVIGLFIDRALGFKMCLRKNIYTWPKAAILTCGYRHNLRPHVKNA